MPTAIPTSPSSPPPIRKRVVSAKHKRISTGGGGDESSSASPLQPSRQANITPTNPTSQLGKMNDDVAEKASRRKSAHFGDLGEGRPGENGRPGKRVVSALAVQAQQQQQQQHGLVAGAGGASMASRRTKRLSAVAPVAPVNLELDKSNFEEWMKLATDNKITANNTWNFALIDYFADLTLLRNDEDQSINFQKASCTLDGCVKIWTSRVDSVATETGKLLSGLAGGGNDDAEDGGADGDEEEGAEPKATRKTTHRSEATLAKSFAALQVKKFDLEFTVDPLFKKTSADFDEGGAMGLLMNHLGVDGKGRVVFDAGDAMIGDEDEELAEADEELVDLSRLRAFMPSAETMALLNISDTLSSFRFSSDPGSMPDLSTIVGLKDTWDEDAPQAPLEAEFGEPSAPMGEEHDFFGGEDFDAPGGGGFDDAMSMAGDDEGDDFGGPSTATYGGGALGMAASGESFAPFDPRRQGGELVMAMASGDGDDGEGMFDYFDKGFGKAWAGAEHWKLRKVTRKDAAPPGTPTAKTTRAAKAPFTIDFTSETAAQSSKTLFAPATKSAITLPESSSSKSASSKRSKKKGTSESKKRREEWLLPDDMHFSSRQLLRLFLKPKFALRMRRNAGTLRDAQTGVGEIDENFWAQAAADRVNGDGEDGDGSAMPIPFESQFFHDDGDGGDVDGDDAADFAFVDDDLDPGNPGAAALEDDDLLAGTQGQVLRKSRPENVHFAKKAKRVDVKRLKDDIWHGLKVVIPEEAPSSESDNPTTPAEEQSHTFDTVIQNLRQSYPTDKMSEISTSFCFICLLHLANEEGLRIETARFDGQDGEDVGCVGVAEVKDAEEDEFAKPTRRRMDDGERTDRIVGELQALKVYKDPNAGRAA